MSLYQREGSPYWQYDFTVHGIRFRGSTGKQTKRQASIVEAELRNDAANKKGIKDDWRIRELLGTYWNDHAKHTKSAKTIYPILDALSRILGPDAMLMDIRSDTMMNYRATRRAEVEKHTVNRDIAHLKAAMNHARNIYGKEIPVISWKKIQVQEPPHRIRYLTKEEYRQLIEAAHPRIRPIITFAVATGLRKANILQLDWRQVDLHGGWVTLITKGDNAHQIRLAGPAKAVLSTMRIRDGRVFDTTNFRKLWYQAVRDANLKDFRFHDLRHTFASWARMEGADIADICDALGHSNIAVTMKYAHIKPDEHITAFDRVANSFAAHSASQSQEKAS